ncbi:hypothetical protein AK812_SmicGene41439 [Symbiodinium microadriaticum]|uniref:Uncharacterized protein n=1 Tax=Symbiodinium microadriaticum TaxID=2951 RepID=A0A1Q9C675_SYMMI|nr:hypothetical protein AK812_SmicGene41439 [Symbiodinium microadriaticum]
MLLRRAMRVIRKFLTSGGPLGGLLLPRRNLEALRREVVASTLATGRSPAHFLELHPPNCEKAKLYYGLPERVHEFYKAFTVTLLGGNMLA